MKAAHRGKVRSLLHLSRRLRTDQPSHAEPSPDSQTPVTQQRRLRKDPRSCSVLLFPGQGSQFVGMVGGLLKYPNVRDMFSVAQRILGYDLLSLCLNGPEMELQKTVHCQPAVFVASLAAVERLHYENPKALGVGDFCLAQKPFFAKGAIQPRAGPRGKAERVNGWMMVKEKGLLHANSPTHSSEAVETCAVAAGFSVGEFTALVFSGAMDFAEALYVVKVRAEAMQRASELVSSGMLSVIGRPQAQYKQACLQAKEHCRSLGIQEPVCSVANYLFPDGRVIAGHQQALDFLQQKSRSLHFTRTKLLPVSGAFHTDLMASATEPLRNALREVEVRRPEISIYSNVDGKRYMSESHIRRQLVKQVVSSVKWEQTLHEIYERTQGESFPHTYEVGPGKQLGATLQKCNRKAFQTYVHVDVAAYEE